MKIDPVHLRALQAFGYTETEARFLYLVATFSGYFLTRQFLAFAGASEGERSAVFRQKLGAKKHARTCSIPGHRVVYHLFAPELYRQLGRENPGNGRRHQPGLIQTRISLLDFVLANQEFTYLETEAEKVRFFCGDLQIEPRHLPGRSYLGPRSGQPGVRYFLDRFPLFLEEAGTAPRVATFSFLQGSEASLAALAHHLQIYSPLFRELSEFRFLYLAEFDAFFEKARELFRALVEVPLEANPAEELLRYFANRKLWELRQFGSLSEQELVFQNAAKERFKGERFEHYYRAWKTELLPESQIRTRFRGHPRPPTTHFAALLVRPLLRACPGQERRRELLAEPGLPPIGRPTPAGGVPEVKP